MQDEYASPPLIRRAASRDASEVIGGINSICSEGGAFFTTRFVNTPEWDAVLYRPESVPNHILAVAEWNGQIVGAGRLFSAGEYTLMKHTAELGLFVLGPFRRRGIGSKIFNWLVKWARLERIEKITLVTFATNEPAVCFFKKEGFGQLGRMVRQIKTLDGYTDLLYMEKFLP